MRRGEPSRQVARLRRAADAVPQPGVRDVDAAVATQPRAPAEVEVLPLQEEGLVEAAELEQELAADEHRGAVGAHCRHGLAAGDVVIEVETRDVLPQEPPAGERRARLHVAPSLPVDLAGVGREERAVRGERGGEQLEAAVVESDVVVQEQDELGCRRAGALVVEVTESAILALEHARAERLRDLDAPVGRGAVDDEHLGRRQRLGCEAREAVGEEVLAPVVADHDGDVRHRRAPRTRLRARRGGAPASGAPRRRRGPARACSARRCGVGERGHERLGERLGLEVGEHRAAAGGANELLRPAARGHHDRCPRGERLGDDDPEALLQRGEDEERGPAQLVGDRRDLACCLDAGRQRPDRCAADEAEGRVSGRCDRTCGHASSSRRTFLRGSSARPTKTTVGRRSSRSRPIERRCRRVWAGSRPSPARVPRPPRFLHGRSGSSRRAASRRGGPGARGAGGAARSARARAAARAAGAAAAPPTPRRATSRSRRRRAGPSGAPRPRTAPRPPRPTRCAPAGPPAPAGAIPRAARPSRRAARSGGAASSGSRPSSRAARTNACVCASAPPPKRGSCVTTARSVTRPARRSRLQPRDARPGELRRHLAAAPAELRRAGRRRRAVARAPSRSGASP